MPRNLSMNCECIEEPGGSHTLVIRVENLTAEEHDRLAIYMHDPMIRMVEFATNPQFDVCDCDDCVARRAAYADRRPHDVVSTGRRLNS